MELCQGVLAVEEAADLEAVVAWVPSTKSMLEGHCIHHIARQTLAQTDTVMNERVEAKEYQDEMQNEPLSVGLEPTGMAYILLAVDGAEEG